MLNSKSDISRSPVFDIMVIFNDDRSAISTSYLSDEGFKVMDNDLRTTSQFDGIFSFVVNDAGVELNIEYNTDIYEPAFIERMIGHYRNLLRNVIGRPEQAIGHIDYLSGEERRELLEAFNDTAVSYPGGTLGDLFKRQVALRRDSTAVE